MLIMITIKQKVLSDLFNMHHPLQLHLRYYHTGVGAVYILSNENCYVKHNLNITITHSCHKHTRIIFIFLISRGYC